MPKPTFKEIKERVEKLKAKRERAQGALDQISKRLQDEFGVTLEDAPAKLEQLQKAATKAKTTYDKTLDSFLEEWGEKLGLSDEG